MILPDVNTLVYASHPDGLDHDRYAAWLTAAVDGPEDVGLVDAALVGLARIATNKHAFERPATATEAARAVANLRLARGSVMLAATPVVWDVFTEFLATDERAVANLVPDAWLAAMAIAHGGRLATRDKGMARWPGLDWFDPLDEVD